MTIKDTIFVLATDAYVEHRTKAQVIAIKRFETGFYPIMDGDPEHLDENNGGPVPREVIESAVSASMYGWNAPISRAAHDWFAKRDSAGAQPGAIALLQDVQSIVKQTDPEYCHEQDLPHLSGADVVQILCELQPRIDAELGA
jgi:hypothetical protein